MAGTGQRRLVTLTLLALGALGAGLLAVVLAAVALAAARPGRPVAVQDLVSAGVATLGAVTAAWLAASCALGWACLAGRLLGARWRAGEVALRRCAPIVVRRAVAGAVGASLGLGLVATGAHAAPVVEPTATSTAAPTTATTGWRPSTADAAGTSSGSDAARASARSDAAGTAAGTGVGTSTSNGTSTDGGPGADTGADGFVGVAPGAGGRAAQVRDAGVAPEVTVVLAPDPGAPPLTWQVTTPEQAPPVDPQESSTPSPALEATDEGRDATPGTAPATADAPADVTATGPTRAAAQRTADTDRDADVFADVDEQVAPRVVVEQGDSLWSIAAAHLPAGASDAAIAAAWPHWYEANRTLIGADPDVLLVGQSLEVPMETAR